MQAPLIGQALYQPEAIKEMACLNENFIVGKVAKHVVSPLIPWNTKDFFTGLDYEL